MKTLSELVHVIKERMGGNLTSLVLFGSQSRGDAGPASDYDILLVARVLPPKGMERYRHIRESLRGVAALPVSFTLKTEEEIDKDITSLLLDIAIDGKTLYDNGFMSERLDRLRKILDKKGLIREKVKNSFFWKWKVPPASGRWEISWNDL